MSQNLSLSPKILGVRKPRLFTPPLVELTPETSYGFRVIEFARDVVKLPLDPWQEEAVIRLGELLPDGRPRFSQVLILVSRQNGKTTLIKVLTLWWLFEAKIRLVLGMANLYSNAKEIWADCVFLAQNSPELQQYLGKKAARTANGEVCLTTTLGTQYKITAANRNAGRSLTVHRLIVDELRNHHNEEAWSAAKYAMNAVLDSQVIAITNQGDDESVVLDKLRKSALEYIETGEGADRLCLLEWSAPDGCDPESLEALAQANPNMGYRIDHKLLLDDAKVAKAAGGKSLADFRTEVLCQRVKLLDPAIDPDSWQRCATTKPIDLAQHRDKVALCLDISMNGDHATLMAAAAIDGLVHVEVVQEWAGFGCTQLVRRQLPELAARFRPRQLGWFPNGPAASITADMEASRPRGWPPRGVELVEIRGETTAVCMGLAELVRTGGLRHPNQMMLNSHVAASQKLYRGDLFSFRRIGVDPIDGGYALAGAVHLARILPPPRPPVVAL